MAVETPASTTPWLSWAPLVLSVGGLLWIASVKINTIDTLQREVSSLRSEVSVNSTVAREASHQIGLLQSRIEVIIGERNRVLSELLAERHRAQAQNAEQHTWFDQRLRSLEVRERQTDR